MPMQPRDAIDRRREPFRRRLARPRRYMDQSEAERLDAVESTWEALLDTDEPGSIRSLLDELRRRADVDTSSDASSVLPEMSLPTGQGEGGAAGAAATESRTCESPPAAAAREPWRVLREMDWVRREDVPSNATARPATENRLRGTIGRARRRSFDEERLANSMRQRLRRCLERSTSAQETTDGTEEDEPLGPSEPEYPLPAYCSLLSPGLEFKGVQRCLRTGGGRDPSGNSIDDWDVHVQIRVQHPQGMTLGRRSVVCVFVRAFVKNNAPVKTFWEGEIIDNKNHTFRTDKWSADTVTDIGYWTKFAAFNDLKSCVRSKHWMSPRLRDYPFIFMRWKETYFLSEIEQNLLSIKGFYYICMCRQSGEMTGYYYDPDCQPFQELELVPDRRGGHGFAFSHAAFI